MTDRGRLINILKEIKKTPTITCPQYGKPNWECQGCKYDRWKECDVAERVADYLIENGVTFKLIIPT